MPDLPADRIVPGQPLFTSVGVDIFGPWEVVTRRTRGVPANSKRWAAIFTCLVTRAIHIEVVEEMSPHLSTPWKVSLLFEDKRKSIVPIEGPTLLVLLTLYKSTQSLWRIPQSRTIYTPGE